MDIWFQIDGGIVGQWVDFNPIGIYPPEYIWVNVGDNPNGIQSGWIASLVNDEWVISPPPPPTPEQVAAPIFNERDWRVSQVLPKISQIECLIGIGQDRPGESEILMALKNHVVQLARISDQPDFPYNFDWPEQPVFNDLG